MKCSSNRGCLASQALIAGGFVSAVVVHDQVDLQVSGHLLVDPDQELLELHGPVPTVQGRDDFTRGDVEGGEQRGQAVADVVVGAPLGHARHHRQHRLGPVQGLDLRLLIHRQHHRTLGRVEVQTHDVVDLLHEQRIRRQLEGVRQMRLELELPPDPSDRGLRQTTVLGHRRPRPVGGVPGQLFQRGDHHRFHLIDADSGRPARPRLVDQSVQPHSEEAPPPLADGVRAHPQIPGDRDNRRHLRPRTGQHDPRPQRQGLRR